MRQICKRPLIFGNSIKHFSALAQLIKPVYNPFYKQSKKEEVFNYDE